MMEADNTKDKNWSIKWMQKAEVLNCVFNRWKELQNGAEPRSEEDTLLWILDRAKNNMIGFSIEEIAAMSNGSKKCSNANICPFFNKRIYQEK